MFRSRRRKRITAAFDAVHEAAGLVLGAAAGRRDAAVRAHARALAEMWLREKGLDGARADPQLRSLLDNRQLAGLVEAIDAERRAAYGPWLKSGPHKLTSILAEAAPGSAGDPVSSWLGGAVSETEATLPVPELWSIGLGWIGDRPRSGLPVAVPLLDGAHLQVSSTPDGRAAAEELVQNLLLRVLSYFRPGLVQLHVWDVGTFTGTLPGLYPLTRTGLLTVHDPGRLPQLLEELSHRIRRVHTRVLVDGQPSLRALAADRDGERSEPWVIAVLIGNRAALDEDDHRQLQRVARGGLACGVQLVLLDVPISVNAAVETVAVADDGSARTSMTGPHVRVQPDPAPEPRKVTAHCSAIADWHDEWRRRVIAFEDLHPDRTRGEEWGAATSHRGLVAPVGFADGERVDLVLDDAAPHALIGGPSGSGKTNLLLTMICSLAARYSPDEVEFYLLDFKEGVSFAQLAPGRSTDNWLPHARLIGVHINTDREFGLALLQYLAEEMRRRAAEAKAHEVTKLEELREKQPDERWPRIVAVIDEFQYLFNETDAVSRAAMLLLEDVARRGRSQGIHLVLASQDVSGIQAFWGRPAVFEQFVLRIALPRARRVLVETNHAAVDLPRWHAVLNHESGTAHANVIVRVPNASLTGLMDREQARLRELYPTFRTTPRLFDGNRAPRVDELVRALGPTEDGLPRAVLGQRIDMDDRPAAVTLSASPGRNIGVLGSVGRDAIRVLEAAAGSLSTQYPPQSGLEVVIAPLVAEAMAPAERLRKRFEPDHKVRTVLMGDIGKAVEELAQEAAGRLRDGVGPPKLVVLFAADATDTILDRTGVDHLRRLLRIGPETGIHVLGWWRSIQRLRTLLGMGASVDDLGAWVALDVHGAELGPLVPGMLVSWAQRAGRGFFFDRAQHSQPEVIIVPAREDP